MSKVKLVEDFGEDLAYDLEVDHPDHQFYLANGVLTSNSHAVGYSITSYQTAVLRHDYESEWLCAYVEDMMADKKKKSQAIEEVVAAGYKIADIDVQFSGLQWTISPDGKTFYPALSAIKGIGEKAIEELCQARPFKNIEDFLWDDNGEWRFSKFNKKSLSLCIRMEAFKSFDIVGPGKMFPNWRAMHEVLIENDALVKKHLKKNPYQGRDNFYKLVEEHKSTPDWTIDQKILDKVEFLGNFSPTDIMSAEEYKKIEECGYNPISIFEETGDYWWILVSVDARTTKNGKEYLSLDCMGEDGIRKRVVVWAPHTDAAKLSIARPYCGKIEKCDFFGCKAKFNKMNLIEV